MQLSFNQVSSSHPTQNLFLLICGEKYILLFFSLYQTKTFWNRNRTHQKFGFKSLDRTQRCNSAYVSLCLMYIETVDGCSREESLSMLVQHWKPLQVRVVQVDRMVGGPRLMGLSELGSRQLQKQAIVIFACVLQDTGVPKGSLFLFSCWFFFQLFLCFKTLYLMKSEPLL